MTERKQNLQQRRQQLAQVLKQRSEQDFIRSGLLAKQRTDMQQLTTSNARLQTENEPLLRRRNKLIQAGWLSEDELPPLDLSPILANLPPLDNSRW